MPEQNDEIWAIAVAGDGTVYVGGEFNQAGGVDAMNIAQWNGTSWSALGDGTSGTVQALAWYGGHLYAAGLFGTAGGVTVNYVAEWNGTNWGDLGSGMNHTVQALTVDDIGNLYAGGSFTVAGGVPANRVAKWSGGAWSALGAGMPAHVGALAADAAGNLYVGGSFYETGDVPVNHIAKWNGAEWEALGSGLNGNVEALILDGNDILYAGGWFSQAGGQPANRVAKWDVLSQTWTALGDGLVGGYVNSLALDDVGNLYAGGGFQEEDGAPGNNIAWWNGTTWGAIGSGVNNEVNALAVHNNRLYAGGIFSQAGGKFAQAVAYADLTQTTGSLNVTIEPEGARIAGAQWRRGSLEWHDSGYTEMNVPTGSHTVEFKPVAGWSTPASRDVTVNEGQTAETTGTYTSEGTDVCGTITSNSNWTTAGNPYRVTCDVIVASGVTLSIDPGVVVKFNSGTKLTVQGTLNAFGTSGSKIVFTSIKDDTVGANSNGAGGTTTPAPGDWAGIYVQGDTYESIASMEHAVIRYGGELYTGPSDPQAALWVYGSNATLTMANTTVEQSSHSGLYVEDTSGTDVESCAFQNNNEWGIVYSSSPVSLTGNTFENNSQGAVWCKESLTDIWLSTNSASGNGSRNGVCIEGTVTGSQWQADSAFPYVVTGDVTVGDGAQLDIEQGAVLKFESGNQLTVQGSLNALGTESSEIVFTSIKDDTAGR